MAIWAVFLRSLRIERTNRDSILRIFHQNLQNHSNRPSPRPSGGTTDALTPFFILPTSTFEVNDLLNPRYGSPGYGTSCKVLLYREPWRQTSSQRGLILFFTVLSFDTYCPASAYRSDDALLNRHSLSLCCMFLPSRSFLSSLSSAKCFSGPTAK